jgi:hypothetical protein
MAIEKVIDIKIQGNADQAIGTLRQQLKQAVADVQNLSEAYGENSRQAIEAAKKAASIKDRIEDANDAILAFKGEGTFLATSKALTSVASGFTAVQGAMGLMGAQGEEVEQALLKVQSAMAVSQGLAGLEDAGRSFKQLKAVGVDALKGIKAGIGATGIGLLVVALGTIAANWEDIVSAAKEAFPALNNVGNVFNKLKEYAFGAGNVIKNYILMPFKALGQLIAGDFKGAIEEIKKGFDVVGNYEAGAAKERQNQRDEAAAEQLAKLVKDNENRIAVLKASGKDTYALELENLKNKQKLYKDDQEKLDQALQDERVLRATHGKQLSDAETALNKKLAEERFAARQKEAEELAELAKQKAERIQEDFDNLYKANQDAQKVVMESTMTQQEIEIAAIDKKYQDQIALATKLGQDTTTLTDAFAAERTAVMQKYASEEDRIREEQKQKDELAAEQTKVRERAVANAKLDIAQNTLALIGEIAGKGSKVGKALALAQATISGYQGVQNAYTTAQASPITIGFPAYPYIQAGLAGAFSLLQIKKIMSTDPSGSSAPNLGGGAGGAGGGATPPSFNVVGSTGVNQLAGAIGNREAAPVQTYVVAQNVTSAQSLQRNIIESATLGG